MQDNDEERAKLREARREAILRTEQEMSEADVARDRMREAVKSFSDLRRRDIEAEVRRIMSETLRVDLSQPGWRGWVSFNVRRRIEQEIVARRELGANEFEVIDMGHGSVKLGAGRQAIVTPSVVVVAVAAEEAAQPGAAQALIASARAKWAAGSDGSQKGLF